MQIKLSNDYYIQVEPNCYVLKKDRLIETGSCSGEIVTEALGYYSNIETLVKSLIRKNLFDLDVITNMNNVVPELDRVKEEIITNIKTVMR